METPQRFEGASIEEVLGRVRAQLGTDAEIIEANKVRSGGIGGFFSKERFEVLALPVSGPAPRGGSAGTSSPAGRGRPVGPMLQGRTRTAAAPAAATHDPATPDPAAGDARQPAAPVAMSLMDIAERVSAAETAGSDDLTGPQRPSGSDLPEMRRTRAQQVAEQVMSEHLRRLESHQSPAAEAAVFEPMRPMEMPRISTEGSAFTEVLQRIANDAGHEIAEAVSPRVAEMAQSMVTPTPAPTVTVPTAAGNGPVATEMAVRQDAAGSMTVAAAATPDAEAHAVEVPSPAPASQEQGLQAPDVDIHVADEPLETPGPERLPIPLEHQVQPAQSRTERLLSWLELEHLPPTTLMSALRALPQMESLPETRGVVVAVVGERSRALRLCRQLARAYDSDPRDVVLASPSYRGQAIPEEQRIIDLTDAARDRRGWRRRNAPTFVAVESPTSLASEAQTWTREIIEALDAHQVIGVVRAARKAEDIRAWADVVGGVDGLALEELDETTTPYAVLALEIPVAYLGEQPATPGSWAQLLMERTAA